MTYNVFGRMLNLTLSVHVAADWRR